VLDRFLAGALLFSLVACARPVASAPAAIPVASVKAAPLPADGPRSSVIALNEGQSVDLASDGTMLDVAKDMRIAIHQRVFTVKKESADGKYSCHLDFDPPYDFEGEYHGEGLSLVDPVGKAKVIIEKTEQEQDGAMSIDKQGSMLAGVVGSYLFLREQHLFFGCGAAHPIQSVVGFVWDASTGKRVELTPPASAIERARTQLAGRGNDESPRLAEAIPRFDEEGRLSIGWRFEKGTTYADSDGTGSDYTISTIVESSELPEPLAQYREPPTAIRNYLANGGEPIVGYTTLN
jgi:hypothetical protein